LPYGEYRELIDDNAADMLTYRGAGIDGEEEARVLNLVIEQHPRYRRLNNDVHTADHVSTVGSMQRTPSHYSLICVQGQNLIHE
jgi:hypothetical protein